MTVLASHSLSQAQARRIWLRAQRLDTLEPFGDGTAGHRRRGRASRLCPDRYHQRHRALPPPYSLYRIPDYRRADLRQAQSVDKSVFEYWTHALSYVPSADLRFFLPAMRRHRREGHRWLNSVAPADLRKVMRLIRRDGALTIRDIDDDVLTEKEHLWASRKPSKRALQLAFYTGALTISERTGMLKTYELMDAAFRVGQAAESRHRRRETTAYLLDRALARARRRQSGFDLSSRRAEQARGSAPDRGAGPA